MITEKYIIPFLLISLHDFTINTNDTLKSVEANKHSLNHKVTQENFTNTMDYNYITTEDWINSYMKTYQDVMP